MAPPQDPNSPFTDPTVLLTGHDSNGKAIVQNSTVEATQIYAGMRTSHNLLYTTSESPPDLNNDKDIKLHNDIKSSGKLNIVNAGGTLMRYVNFAPQNTTVMHRTQSLDYGVVMEGEMIMELDDGNETLLRRGDVAIQRATMHAWKNASKTEWARMLFVLQDCQSLSVEGQRLKEDLGVVGSSIFTPSGNDK
ncbi:hypothetical protein LTR56_003822 [Elasticomyces elasticus]|nr:hypothetical protein LTR22_013117 [Elasticomyces elasticus]KAK3654964.1 hypothetical protein LTR56_003822 [Elasticomyces elasticus]KAK4928704.1 hypothetical protein LTR49_004513 [Elasticomyces elasticus]KAK5766668.1 hypothetical protein LTS12_003287 [Elasticomyces elasticus]